MKGKGRKDGGDGGRGEEEGDEEEEKRKRKEEGRRERKRKMTRQRRMGSHEKLFRFHTPFAPCMQRRPLRKADSLRTMQRGPIRKADSFRAMQRRPLRNTGSLLTVHRPPCNVRWAMQRRFAPRRVLSLSMQIPRIVNVDSTAIH